MIRKLKWKSTKPPQKRVLYDPTKTIVSVVFVLLVLSGFLFFLKPSVTGAASTYLDTTNVNSIDMDWNNPKLTVGFDFPGHEMSAIRFVLSGDFDCTNFSEMSIPLPLSDTLTNGLNATNCDTTTGNIEFYDASLSDYNLDRLEAVIKFRNLPNNLIFNVTQLQIYNTSFSEDFVTTIQAPFEPVAQTVTHTVSSTTTTSTTTNNNNPGGSPGGGCSPRWRCDSWDLCNADLEQNRTCSDTRCNRNDKVESQSCPVCQESWVCGAWSACSGGQETRTCVDEHSCRTSLQKPDLTRACTVQAQSTGGQNRFTGNQQQTTQVPVTTQQPASSPSILEEYKIYFIAGPVALVLVVILVVILILIHKKKKVHYNYDELKVWIQKELAMGTIAKDVKKILIQNTGWKSKEVDAMFQELTFSGRYKPGTICKNR